MKKMILAVSAALFLSCAAVSACAPVDPSAALDSTVMDERGMHALESSYNLAGTAYLEAVEAGVLTGARKDEAKTKLQLAYTYLVQARRAYEISDGFGYRSSARAAETVISQAKEYFPAN